MYTFEDLASIRDFLASQRTQKNSVGLVPTMGALHEGHLTLVKKCIAENDLTVVSIFVNPTQFNNPEDFEKYPRNFEADLSQLKSLGVEAVFMPTADDMYPSKTFAGFHFKELETVMEGKFRPGHFNGVGIVVSKLFNIIQPNKAYFGQKDLQQVAIITDMVNALSFPIEIIRVPTIRNEDGLALSSRNERLSQDEKIAALHLYKTLKHVEKSLMRGEDPSIAWKEGKIFFESQNELSLEYLEVVDASSLERANQSTKNIAICIAAWCNDVRLIDNTLITL